MQTGNKKKKAFTLAEVMIVLLILTILFAAIAPLITKRRSATKGQELWQWVGRGYTFPMNAKYINNDGKLFFGISPTSDRNGAEGSGIAISPAFDSNAKVTIRSGIIANNRIQRQLQLRNGMHSDSSLTATLLADTYRNLLFGDGFRGMEFYKGDNRYPKNNLAFGYGALSSINSNVDNPIYNNTAFGYNALAQIARDSHDNVAVGSGAGGELTTGSGNVFVGKDATVKSRGSNNTLLGYKSQIGSGDWNTFIGANTGNENAKATGNTAIGYGALNSIQQGNYNVAVGYEALANLQNGNSNTAIGYHACFNLINGSNKTCIGANSGPKLDAGDGDSENKIVSDGTQKADRHISATDTSGSFTNDTQITYIGNQKNPNLGGDAVLEIHNIGGTNNNLINHPTVKSNTTTVINGDLFVRGNSYFTVGNALYPFGFQSDSPYYYGFGKTIDQNNVCASNQTTYTFNACHYKNAPNDATDKIILNSDRRLKYIGSRNNDGYNQIKQLQVYNFKFKNDKNKEPHTGVIAQELQKVFPKSVTKGEDGYLRIRWDEMFYACINALKTLNQRVASLVKRTVSLEDEITKLEKENSELKTEIEKLSARVAKLKR